KARAKNREIHKYYMNSMSFKNLHNCCPEQIDRRYNIVADIVGREPSLIQIKRHDPGLVKVISSRFGTVNKYRKSNGYQVIKKSPIFTSDKTIAGLRRFYEEFGRTPRLVDLTNKTKMNIRWMPGVKPIKRHFGSLNNALITAGFKPNLIRFSRQTKWFPKGMEA